MQTSDDTKQSPGLCTDKQCESVDLVIKQDATSPPNDDRSSTTMSVAMDNREGDNDDDVKTESPVSEVTEDPPPQPSSIHNHHPSENSKDSSIDALTASVPVKVAQSNSPPNNPQSPLDESISTKIAKSHDESHSNGTTESSSFIAANVSNDASIPVPTAAAAASSSSSSSIIKDEDQAKNNDDDQKESNSIEDQAAMAPQTPGVDSDPSTMTDRSRTSENLATLETAQTPIHDITQQSHHSMQPLTTLADKADAGMIMDRSVTEQSAVESPMTHLESVAASSSSSSSSSSSEISRIHGQEKHAINNAAAPAPAAAPPLSCEDSAAEVSPSQLRRHLRDVMAEMEISKITAKSVRQRLEERLGGVRLHSRRKEIKEMTLDILTSDAELIARTKQAIGSDDGNSSGSTATSVAGSEVSSSLQSSNASSPCSIASSVSAPVSSPSMNRRKTKRRSPVAVTGVSVGNSHRNEADSNVSSSLSSSVKEDDDAVITENDFVEMSTRRRSMRLVMKENLIANNLYDGRSENEKLQQIMEQEAEAKRIRQQRRRKMLAEKQRAEAAAAAAEASAQRRRSSKKRSHHSSSSSVSSSSDSRKKRKRSEMEHEHSHSSRTRNKSSHSSSKRSGSKREKSSKSRSKSKSGKHKSREESSKKRRKTNSVTSNVAAMVPSIYPPNGNAVPSMMYVLPAHGNANVAAALPASVNGGASLAGVTTPMKQTVNLAGDIDTAVCQVSQPLSKMMGGVAITTVRAVRDAFERYIREQKLLDREHARVKCDKVFSYLFGGLDWIKLTELDGLLMQHVSVVGPPQMVTAVASAAVPQASSSVSNSHS